MSTRVEQVKDWHDLDQGLTILAGLTFPSLTWYFHNTHAWGWGHAAVVAVIVAVLVRAALGQVARKFMPLPSLFGVDDADARANDVMARRRYWFWRFWTKVFAAYTSVVFLSRNGHGGFVHHFTHLAPSILTIFSHPGTLLQGAQVMALFLINFLIFMGPMLAMGVSQIKTYEPGDAKWGVKLDDVRGQKEAKEEIRRVVEIWQSGEQFEKLGGKRERGMLFLGPPGVGKTMLAKAIATSFNSPIVTIPGSGFAQMFMGLDAIIVRLLNRKAKKVSRKWGGQCIVFIDEIDAVGRARNQQGTGAVGGGMLGGMMGGGMGMMALNQLLVVMDSIDSPPPMKLWFQKKINLVLDAVYFVPRKVGGVSLRIPPLKPSGEQVYWLGATNIALEALDPALTRAGRMGRHIYFRNPTKEDRKDVFDRYLGLVAHEADLDTPARRDELARVTQGVSPASIEQICSMGLIGAQNDGRDKVSYNDLLEALTTLEAGTAVGVDYTDDETEAVALHEAGHATAAHIYTTEQESSRLSIRMRGNSLGHHQAFDKEEKFGKWRSEDFGQLIRGLAAMATEYVFYGENGRGVSGDLQMSTSLAQMMVSRVGMTPYFTEYPELELLSFPLMEPKRVVLSDAERVLKKFEFVGKRLMSSQDQPFGTQGDKSKDAYAAQFMGHAFVTAWNFVKINEAQVRAVADALVERKEIYGDDLNKLLDDQNLVRFDPLDLKNFLDIDAWPVL